MLLYIWEEHDSVGQREHFDPICNGLIDEYQIMVHPVGLEEGTPILKGINRKPDLKLITNKAFKSWECPSLLRAR